MNKRRILVQWIGHSDLRAMAEDCLDAKKEKILAVTGKGPKGNGGHGPTKTLLNNEEFDEVKLLSDYSTQLNTWFLEWLKMPADMVSAKVTTPVHYGSIYSVTDQYLAQLTQSISWSDTELCFHLSPGTPAMTVILLFLGKTRYPATFYETSRDGSSSVCRVPFDLLDIVPEILGDTDLFERHLAAESPSEVEGFGNIIGNSQAIRTAVGRAKRVALSPVSVLLLGESGTGKEMFAEAIHKASCRKDRPFKIVNCALLSGDLLASELFGHEKGAFTGAISQRDGVFRLADGGTVFLDEIGECDSKVQAMLLRVLNSGSQEGLTIRKFFPLGTGAKEVAVDVRIIAATNRILHEAIAAGTFRDDLYYRLSAVTITLPALRDRKADIPMIAKHLLGKLNKERTRQEKNDEEHGLKVEDPAKYVEKTLTKSARTFLKSQEWRGNVRQLYNSLMQATVFCDGTEVKSQDLIASGGDMPESADGVGSVMQRELGEGFSLDELLDDVRRTYVTQAMEEANGIQKDAADMLGLKNSETLRKQLLRLGIRKDHGNNK